MLITQKRLASSQQFLTQLLYLTRAIDIDSADNEATKFADLYFFGPRGEIVVGKEALTLLSSIRGQANTVPQNLLAIVGK
jgi:hypothetical protein